jgi:hypothetical protein
MGIDRYWFLTWTTYGTWLPGDVRGSVPGDPDPELMLRDYKAYASRALNRRWRKPDSGTWWTESGSKRKLKDEAAILAAARYIRDQEFPLVVWIHPKFAPELAN